MRVRRVAAALLSTAAFSWSGAATAQQASAPRTAIVVDADTPGPTYDRRIFTQFAEHLGNGIYGALWVGNDRRISNTRAFTGGSVADGTLRVTLPPRSVVTLELH